MTPLATRTPSHRAGSLSATASIALLSSVVISFLASSAVPTPLYAVY
jgi:hypothetical protein